MRTCIVVSKDLEFPVVSYQHYHFRFLDNGFYFQEISHVTAN